MPLYAGAVADVVDRRRLLLLSDVALAVVTIGLLANASVPEPSVALLFVAEALSTAAYAFQRPARNALTPALVGEEQLVAAIAVEDVVFNLARVAGPAFAGVLIAAIGLAGAYAVDLVTFAASLVAIWLLPPVRPVGQLERADLRSVVEGFRFVRRTPVLLGAISLDLVTVGFLYAAPYAGALAASLLSGWLTRVRRQGLGVFVAAGLWGVAIALFGLADAVWLALITLAAAGAADYVSAVLRSTILLTVTPDAIRGRVSGIELTQVASAPAVGNLEAGIVASLTSLRFSITSGGVACVAGTIVCALAFPALLRYDARRARTA